MLRMKVRRSASSAGDKTVFPCLCDFLWPWAQEYTVVYGTLCCSEACLQFRIPVCVASTAAFKSSFVQVGCWERGGLGVVASQELIEVVMMELVPVDVDVDGLAWMWAAGWWYGVCLPSLHRWSHMRRAQGRIHQGTSWFPTRRVGNRGGLQNCGDVCSKPILAGGLSSSLEATYTCRHSGIDVSGAYTVVGCSSRCRVCTVLGNLPPNSAVGAAKMRPLRCSGRLRAFPCKSSGSRGGRCSAPSTEQPQAWLQAIRRQFSSEIVVCSLCWMQRESVLKQSL